MTYSEWWVSIAVVMLWWLFWTQGGLSVALLTVAGFLLACVVISRNSHRRLV
jgi:hypothetical protein